jgi:hypothetical protein
VCGVAVGAIRRLRDDSDRDMQSNPVMDYAVPVVGVTGVMTGLREMITKSELAKHKPKVLPGVGMTFGTGVVGGLVAGAVGMYVGTLIGSAIVDVRREYQRQQLS